MAAEAKTGGNWSPLLRETGLVAGAITAVLFYTIGDDWTSSLSDPWWTSILFVWLFGVMLWCVFGVVRHAEALAVLLGEPYGTLILTMAVIGIEASLIAAIMLSGDANPTLARDTMFAIYMIVLNGLVGLSLLLGGLRHIEQDYNLQGANAFLAVIVPLSVIALVLPRYTVSTAAPAYTPAQAAFFSLATILLYAAFLAIQTSRHRDFFMQPKSANSRSKSKAPAIDHEDATLSPLGHALLLILTLLPIVLLSKELAKLVDFGIFSLGAPVPLGGVLIAVLVLTPEGVVALRAAVADQLQRSVNICLGAALSTIGMTVPAVLAIGLVTGKTIELGLENRDVVLLVLTLFVSALTFSSTKTNVLQGAVHLVLFLAYLMLIFSP
jgi:Ca2+:H+ antiporter